MGRAILLTRDLAFAYAKDSAMRLAQQAAGYRGAGAPLLPWSAVHEFYVDELRKLWTLDDEFTQQDFVALHGRTPSPFSDDDFNEVQRIWSERQAQGLVYGPIPES